MSGPTKRELQERIGELERELVEARHERSVMADALLEQRGENELQNHLIRAYRHILGIEDLWGRG